MEQRPANGATSVTIETAIEIVGYMGAAIGVAGTFVAIARIAELSEWAALLVTFGVGAALLVAGWLFGRRPEERLKRMQSVLWFGAGEALVSAVAILVGPIIGLEGRAAAVVAAILGAGIAAALWWMLRRSLQEIFLFGAALGVLLAVSFPEPSLFGLPDLTATALLIWVFGGVWAFLARRRIVQPVRTGLVLGAIALVVGPLLFTQTRIVGEVLSLATAAGLVALGEWLGERAVAGLGIAGILLVSGILVVEHLGDTTGGAVAALIVGIALLAGALVASAQRGGPTPAQPTSLPPPPPAILGQ